MGSLPGYNGGVQYVATGGPQDTPAGVGPVNGTAARAVVVDGTPIRVVMLAGAAALGLYCLKLSGFKFNVAAST